MKKAILLHGTEGTSQSGWLQWLKTELEKRDFQVWVPDLPRADNPSLAEWSDYVIDSCPFDIDEHTTLIGHSAGAVSVLVITQRLKNAINQIISVASFKDLSYLHEKLDWHANDRFFDVDIDFEKIKQNCNNIIFIHSDNDPYCPLEQAKYLSEKTDGELVVMPGQKHFNKEFSEKYREFPQLLDIINEHS